MLSGKIQLPTAKFISLVPGKSKPVFVRCHLTEHLGYIGTGVPKLSALHSQQRAGFVLNLAQEFYRFAKVV